MSGAPTTTVGLAVVIAVSTAVLPARADLIGGILKGALKASEHAVKGSVDAAVIAGKVSVGATGEAVGAIAGDGGSGKAYKQYTYQQNQPWEQPGQQAQREQRSATPIADRQARSLRTEFMDGQARVQARVDSELASGKLTAEQARSLREELVAIQIREHDARRDSKMTDQEAESLMDAVDHVDSRLDRYLVENMRVGRVRN